MKTEVVKFDVGGQVYKVSRSLLQMHPNSMLAKSASDQWQEDPESEIFMEGNGSRFQYVLDYLRHGSVTLPITESKEALTKELEYYGIDVSENTIDDSAMHKAKSFDSLRAIIQDLRECAATLKTESDRTEIDYRCAQLAVDCAQMYLKRGILKRGIPLQKGRKINVFDYLYEDGFARENIEKLRSLVRNNDKKAREGANVHLNAVGLNLSAYKTVDDKESAHSMFVYRSNVPRRKTATLEEIDVVQTEEEKD